MTAPRIEFDLHKIHHNARILVKRLAPKGISVTGVTKATLGSPEIAGAMLRAGVRTLGDSRIHNIETMRDASIITSMMLLRSPMISEASQVVRHADLSCNTEISVIKALSIAALKARKTHEIILMVELGDLREGIMPDALLNTVEEAQRLPNIIIKGIGANLACRCGVTPDCRNMAELSDLADTIEASLGMTLEMVSGGNSANLQWALSGVETRRINDLRLGESILLGLETLHRQPISGLYTDAITVTGEVIESKIKPSQPWGKIAQTAFGETETIGDRGLISQSLLAMGRQEVDPDGLRPPPGVKILGASSDHLILEVAHHEHPVGSEVSFQPNYSTILYAMTSPFVMKCYH
ncbi:alanine/ornithine racemase family PLP-dependent enzyme [Magnetococcus sp. PR-3]|uniref:alanine/ornithine racemase family PLP-dependent enzyme n=1 Tax=Magnetococcus sp. PR-3 TaxID=3120355 RepID=UPI002FCDF769